MKAGKTGFGIGCATALAVGMAISTEGVAAAQRPAAPNTASDPIPPAPPEKVPTELLQASPGGVTADQVAVQAAATSFVAKAQEETLRAAATRLDAAFVTYLPRLGLTARYTRVSTFTPSFDTGGATGPNFVGTQANGPNPSPTFALPSSALTAGFATAFKPILDNWLLQASVTVPLSDYFLKIGQQISAATHSVEASRFDTIAARAKAASDGKVAFYTWLRARSAVVVAVQSLNDQKTHLTDANNQFTVGNASRADVLRAETAVAAAELAVVRARNLADLAEKQVRVAMHLPDESALRPGESLEGATPPVAGDLKALTAEAMAWRYEIKSMDANAASAKELAKAARNGELPTLSAFADALYANPNPRLVPPTQKWFPTWDVGAQVTWTPNDAVTSASSASSYEAQAAAVEAQRGSVRDGVELEVLQAVQGVREADAALDSTKRELASAGEAYRVARELFVNGRGTSTTLTDAETELTRARLDSVNATADARVARVRLEHALGRDTRVAANAANAANATGGTGATGGASVTTAR